MNLILLPKVILFSILAGISIFFNQFSNREITNDELIIIQARIDTKLEKMRVDVDTKWGEGFFEKLLEKPLTDERLKELGISLKDD